MDSKVVNGKRRRVHKEYVDVIARIAGDGRVLPLRVCWRDGRSFAIDQVLERIGCASARRGMTTELFRIRMGDRETELYMEHHAGTPGIDGPHTRWWVYALDALPVAKPATSPGRIRGA